MEILSVVLGCRRVAQTLFLAFSCQNRTKDEVEILILREYGGREGSFGSDTPCEGWEICCEMISGLGM